MMLTILTIGMVLAFLALWWYDSHQTTERIVRTAQSLPSPAACESIAATAEDAEEAYEGLRARLYEQVGADGRVEITMYRMLNGKVYLTGVAFGKEKT